MPMERNGHDADRLTWSDVRQLWHEYSKEYNCRLTLTLEFNRRKTDDVPAYIVVVCQASSYGEPSEQLRAFGEGKLGGNTGARSMAGAVFKAIFAATARLEKMREERSGDAEPPRLAGF